MAKLLIKLSSLSSAAYDTSSVPLQDGAADPVTGAAAAAAAAGAQVEEEEVVEEDEWEVIEEAGMRVMDRTDAGGRGDEGVGSRGDGGGVAVQDGIVEVLDADTLDLVALMVLLVMLNAAPAVVTTDLDGVSEAEAAAANVLATGVASLALSAL